MASHPVLCNSRMQPMFEDVQYREATIGLFLHEDCCKFMQPEQRADYMTRKFADIGIPLQVNADGVVSHLPGYVEGTVLTILQDDGALWLWTGMVRQ